MKTYDSEDGKSTIARNVLNPPFHTAGPMLRSAFVVLSKNKQQNSQSLQLDNSIDVVILQAHRNSVSIIK